MPTPDRPIPTAPLRDRRVQAASRRRVVWSVNPKETSGSDLLWFIALPVAFALVVGGVIVTAWFAQG